MPTYNIIPEHTFGLASRGTLGRVARTPSETQMTVAALGDPLRILYGKFRVGAQGLLPCTYNGELFLPFIVGRGEIGGVDAIESEGRSLTPYGVTSTIYTGTTPQSVDSTLAAAWLANGRVYNDSMSGIAWGYLRIPGITAAPQEVVLEGRGRKVYDPREVIQLDATISGGGNCYVYRRIMDDAYVIQSGDYLEYDYFVETSPVEYSVGGFEIDLTTSPSNLRNIPLLDTAGQLVNNPSSSPLGRWIMRRIALTGSAVGKTSSSFNLVIESDVAGTYRVLFRNIRITDGAGTVRKTIWNGGALDANTTAYSALASGIACVVATGGTRYSANPVLCLGDFLSNTVFGKGETVDGTTLGACANIADQLIGSTMTRRREFGLAMDVVRTLDDWEEALRTYAGVWIVREGATTYLVADAATSSTFAFTNAAGSANYLADSLRIEQRKRRNNPTVVTVLWTDPATKPWSEGQWTEKQAGAGEAGGPPWREEQVALPGIQDAGFARRECLRRLNEYIVSDIDVALVSVGHAAALRRGDVVTVTDSGGFTAKPFRLISHRPIAPGQWEERLTEYDATLYSNEVATSSPPNTTLPSPAAPTNVALSALVEIVDQLDNGMFASMIRATWATDSYPFVQYYEITVRRGGIVVQTAAAARGAVEWVSQPLAENLTYDVTVVSLSTTGQRSSGASASITLNGKAAIPSRVPAITGFEVGGEVRLTWTPAVDLDLTGHELRYGAYYGTSKEDSTLASQWAATSNSVLDRVAAPAIRYATRNIPEGNWRILIKGLDSVRSAIFPYGQESQYPTSVDLTVTSDASAFVAIDATYVSPTLYNMAAGPGYWVTSFAGDTWNSLFTAALSTYTNPLSSYHASGTSGIVTENYDHGASITGDWIVTATYSALSGTVSAQLELASGPEGAKTITGATNANPIVITATGHGYETGDEVQQSGVGGNTAANGRFLATRIDANSYSLRDLMGANVAGNGTYTSGGTAQRWVWSAFPSLTAKTSARYSRMRFWATTTATLLVTALGNIKCRVIARHESGVVLGTLMQASGPTMTLFQRAYMRAVSAGASAYGSGSGFARVDMIEVSGGRGSSDASYQMRLFGRAASRIEVPDHASLSRCTGTGLAGSDLAFTLEALVKPTTIGVTADNASGIQTIAGKGSGNSTGEYQLRINVNGRPRLCLYDESRGAILGIEGDFICVANEHAHLAGTYDGSGAVSGLKLYANGILLNAVDISQAGGGGAYVAMENTTHPFVIGNQYNGATYNTPLNGTITAVRLWNVVRTQAEIDANKQKIFVSGGTALISYWALHDPSTGASASDYSGNNTNHGTANGTANTDYMWRPFDGMNLYRFNASGTQIGGSSSADTSYYFDGV